MRTEKDHSHEKDWMSVDVTEEMRSQALETGINRHLESIELGIYESIKRRGYERMLEQHVQNALAEISITLVKPFLKINEEKNLSESRLIHFLSDEKHRYKVLCSIISEGSDQEYFGIDAKTHQLTRHNYDYYIMCAIRKHVSEVKHLYILGWTPVSKIDQYEIKSGELPAW